MPALFGVDVLVRECSVGREQGCFVDWLNRERGRVRPGWAKPRADWGGGGGGWNQHQHVLCKTFLNTSLKLASYS